MNPKYSILMTAYKSVKNVINRVNEAYSEQEKPSEFILVINYYSEESWKILEYAKNEPRITRYIFSSQNMGYSKAINLAFKISKSEHVIVLSDDCSAPASTHFGLSQALIPENIGISCVLFGGKPSDTIPIPQGFILGIKSKAIKESGGYIYDEIASPLGCEVELTYRLKASKYDCISTHGQFNHVHDISNNPSTEINYLGDIISPQGKNAFQPYTEAKLMEKIIQHRSRIE